MPNNNRPPQTPHTNTSGAFIDEKGREIPITDDMIKEALVDVKPHSIGWRSGMMEVITDEMLKGK